MRKDGKKRLALASGWMGGLCACLLLLAACGGSSAPSSAALLKTAQVAEVARPQRIHIIGQGGIVNASDAIEFLLAGATAVGVGTALFYDPLVCPKINRGIADYLAARGLANIAALAA